MTPQTHVRLRPQRHRRRIRLLTVTLAASIAFAACSSDGGDNLLGTTGAETATTAAATVAVRETAAPTTAPEITVAGTARAESTVAETSPPESVAETAATEPSATETTAVPGAETEETAAPDTTLAEGPLDPLDDLNEDGTFDERCGTADLGAGLVVETVCDTSLAPAPEGGVIPTPQSLLLIPQPSRWEDLADVDATVRVATAPDGRRIAIYVLGSDTLFDSGKAALRTTAQLPLEAIAASIATRFPNAPIQVRGAADSVGSPAANQTLSELRAGAVAASLAALGIDPSRMTSVGLGSNSPVALETNPDGSVSDIGRQVNRRVEIVVG